MYIVYIGGITTLLLMCELETTTKIEVSVFELISSDKFQYKSKIAILLYDF